MFFGRMSALVLASLLVVDCRAADANPTSSQVSSSDQAKFQGFIESNCLDCHDSTTRTAGLALDEVVAADFGDNREAWEKVVRKLSMRQMPPTDVPRPDETQYEAAVAWLSSTLDDAAAEKPNPGRTETFRRLNRTEYQNCIRDLLGLDVDATALLPPDESSHGFDNITVANLSPTLLNRYLSAAQTISRMALGRISQSPREDTFRMRPDVTQDVHLEGLPIGTRGGMLIDYNFPRDGEYEIQVRLMRDRNDEVESLRGPHELEVLVDRKREALFTVKPPQEGESHHTLDAHLKTRITTTAGQHKVGVTFLAKSASLEETVRQPLNVHFNFYRHPRLGPAVYQVSIIGPYDAAGPGKSPSRQGLFVWKPTEEFANDILKNLLRRAYRRPVDDEDLKIPLEFFRMASLEDGFDAGIEAALTSVLVNPNFLFRVERDPGDVAPNTPYQIDDLELASRLSFFLWSSMPDDELLYLAERGELSQPEVLEQQVRRMLADKRSRSLITNFAEQWLYLRNLESINPDMRLFSDFDDNLRQAMRRETELFFESIIRENRSVLDLIQADYTFLNERLARHYEIPHVYGSQFRHVTLDPATHRGGLLRHGSILTVTSYATRTSPVIRGQWMLENLIGAPQPPPPPNVPELKDNTVESTLSMRERLEQHRADATCASCHAMMDPIGFALENFDAVGRWRESEAGVPVDSSGGFVDGSEFVGVDGLEQALVDRPELFVQTLTEKLFTFALGRGVEYYDAPAIRQIVAGASQNDYRFSELILGIVESPPFQKRMSEKRMSNVH
jgi:hypothetical protein